ncbi:MAG: hypothetical protein QW318_09445, partial [Candidatus Caldarchaeum sp.]
PRHLGKHGLLAIPRTVSPKRHGSRDMVFSHTNLKPLGQKSEGAGLENPPASAWITRPGPHPFSSYTLTRLGASYRALDAGTHTPGHGAARPHIRGNNPGHGTMRLERKGLGLGVS